MQRERVQGVVTEDPLAGPNAPRQITSTSRLFEIRGIEAANHGNAPLGAFGGALLAISFRDDHGQHTLGSAVLVHPGIAVTAKHVVSDWIGALRSGNAAAVCQAPTPETVLLWDVEAVMELGDADLAILCLRFRAALPESFSIGRVTTRTPRIGETLFLTGFTAEVATVPRGPEVAIGGHMRVCHGEVIEVWPQGRDRVMLPSPALAVNCPAFGGMSGGPVFDEAGHLLGVVSSSSDGDEIAYVSHIWPVLLASIEPRWPFALPQTTLLHMGHKQGVSIERPDAFKLEVSGRELVIVYAPD
jgi:hypothetical protein